MSRGYSKFYSRKLNNGSQASIQFDKLFHENSNRPSAAKSAGTIGRWGVISCTSLRSTNINGRRDEGISNKRMRIDFGSRPTSKDPFSFETDPEKIASGERPPPVSKPKKFFKSRNIDSPQEDVINSSMYVGSNCNTEVNYGMQSTRKYSKNQASGGSKKFFSGKKNEDTAESSVSKPAVPAREENKPPIVLRIFKGTSHLVNELKVSSVHPSNKSGSDSVIVRSSSRKKNHVDTNCEYRVTVVHAGSDSSNTSITPPKKSGKESKNKHAEKEREREEKREKERLEKTEEKVEVIEKVEEKRSGSPVPVDDVERAVAALEAGEELYDQQDQDFSAESAVEEVSSASNSLPLSLCYPPNQDSNYMTSCSTENTVESKDLNETQEIPEEDKQDEILKEDNEKLLKAEELLADTYIDFAGTTEKLMQFPQHSSVSPVPTGHTKTFSEHSWFSDSEGSNSILDQINTLTSNQTSRDDSNLEKTENELEGTEQTSPELIDTQELPATQELTDCQEQEEKTFETEQETENDIDMETGRELRSGHISSPAAKKGSIFKSRSLQSDGPRTRRAVYKHKWADTDKEPGPGSSQPSDIAMATNTSEPAVASAYDVDEFEFGKLTRVTTWPAGNTEGRFEEDVVTRVKCNKKDKEYYTVVRNVKRAHQIQESGEFQEFNDDVEYILDALQDNYPIGTRCLSAISLASKCMAPAFRMHVRAHGTVTKFFRALHDATKDQSLALCTATVMFVLSQDRLNMDLDRHSLELMLNLLESDASHRNALDDCGMSSAQLHKNKQKVRELCGEIQGQGHAKHLNLDNITAGHLAMETLLSLTSRRAGEWFKEELRELGGLEHIVKTISECCRQLGEFLVQWTDPLLDQLRKVDRCLRVLENVTHQHEENQLYLLKYGNGILVDTLYRLFCQCDSEIPLYPVIDETDKESPGVVIREALLATLKVLINLSHDFNNQSYGSTMFGEKKGIVDTCLHVLLQVPQYVPEQKKFDLLVLALILLINLVEHSQANRKQLFEARIMNDEDIFYSRTKSAVEVLIALFYEQEELARAEEMKTDEILDGKKDSEEPVAEPVPPKSQEEFIEETVAKLLQKAGRNMEHTLIGAYIGLLLGYLIIDTKEYEIYVRQCLPEGNFKTIISVLQKVYNFMNLTASAVGSSRGIAQTERVINCLIKSDANADTAAANAAAAAAAVMLEAAKVLDTSMDCSSVLDDTVS